MLGFLKKVELVINRRLDNREKNANLGASNVRVGAVSGFVEPQRHGSIVATFLKLLRLELCPGKLRHGPLVNMSSKRRMGHVSVETCMCTDMYTNSFAEASS